MTALSESDFNAVLSIQKQEHIKWMDDHGFNVALETHNRAAFFLHNAMGYRNDQPQY
jgi:hypothetical protein